MHITEFFWSFRVVQILFNLETCPTRKNYSVRMHSDLDKFHCISKNLEENLEIILRKIQRNIEKFLINFCTKSWKVRRKFTSDIPMILLNILWKLQRNLGKSWKNLRQFQSEFIPHSFVTSAMRSNFISQCSAPIHW